MPAIVMFLLGVLASATTSIGEKAQAALGLKKAGYEDQIPQQYQYLLGADGKTVAVPVPAPAPEHHSLIGGWADSMTTSHPWLSMILVVVVVGYAVYKAKHVKQVFTAKARS